MSDAPVRYQGKFIYYEPGFGFLTDVRSVRDGTPLGKDVLLPATTVARCIGPGRHVLLQLRGETLRFYAGESKKNPNGKLPVAEYVTKINHYPLG